MEAQDSNQFKEMESIFGQKSSTSSPSYTQPQQPQPQAQPFSMPSSLQNLQAQIDRSRLWIQQNLRQSTETLRQYINQYPPLAAFLFTLLVLSAVPVSVFVVFGVTTAVFFLSVALIGFSVVQGTILITSGSVLLAVLTGIGLFTTCAFGFFGVCYMGYRGGCAACCQLWQGASYVGSKVQEQAQYMQPGQQASQPTTVFGGQPATR
jgi:hypothetical protein